MKLIKNELEEYDIYIISKKHDLFSIIYDEEKCLTYVIKQKVVY